MIEIPTRYRKVKFIFQTTNHVSIMLAPISCQLLIILQAPLKPMVDRFYWLIDGMSNVLSQSLYSQEVLEPSFTTTPAVFAWWIIPRIVSRVYTCCKWIEPTYPYLSHWNHWGFVTDDPPGGHRPLGERPTQVRGLSQLPHVFGDAGFEQ